MECHGDVLLGPYSSSECPSEVQSEPGISVGDDLLWETKPGVDIFQVKCYNTGSSNSSGAWQEDGCSEASVINDGENGVFPPYPGQTGD
jgi:hypothetical protein